MNRFRIPTPNNRKPTENEEKVLIGSKHNHNILKSYFNFKFKITGKKLIKKI